MKKKYTKKEIIKFLNQMKSHRYGILFKKKLIKKAETLFED